jgi:UDP-3-O-[3-hydroxymyristoyl] glucosamine N-acyltransferase
VKRSLQQIADAIGARLQGDGTVEVRGVASITMASAEHLVFVDDQKHLDSAWKSAAGAVIVGEFAALVPAGKPLLISDHPKLAFARAANFLGAAPRSGENDPARVHSSAVVEASVRLETGVVVEARAVIAANVSVGEGTRIGAGCVIGAGAKIGKFCEIYPQVTVYPGTSVADRVVVHAGAVLGSDGFGYVQDRETRRYEKFPQVGRLLIEDDVEIGANTTIDRGALEETRIGRGAKIDNLVHIGHNCQIGENVIIAAQTGLSGSIVIEKDVVLGGQVGIGEHARIEEGAMLGGQGGVLPHKILRGKGVAFWGTPAQPVREYLKQLAMLARLVKK